MTPTPEFSRLIEVNSLVPDRGRNETVEASEEECAALARRFDLRSLAGLKSKMTILRVSEGGIIRIEGDIKADVVQSCVVSLQDVPSRVQAHFDTYFTEEREIFEQEPGERLEPEEDLCDVLDGGMIDLGELVAQYLSLELEPYPRAPGARLAAQLVISGGDSKNRPFQLLKGLKSEKEE